MTAAERLEPWDDRSVRVTLAIRTISENNAREHWASRAKRRKDQRAVVHLVLPMHLRKCKPEAPYVITLTRVAPRRLDSDNLQGALKAVRDQVAAELGINDGDEAHEWRYNQRHYDRVRREPGLQVGGYGVEVRIEPRMVATR